MQLPDRKPTRISGYNYSAPNIYFVTICTYERRPIFGEADVLNRCGKIAESDLLDIPRHFSMIYIDKYVIMPNHIHALIIFEKQTENYSSPPSLSSVIGMYKSGVSKKIHESLPYSIIWQKSFHDHIIQDDASYDKIWRYIDKNLENWLLDDLYTAVK